MIVDGVQAVAFDAIAVAQNILLDFGFKRGGAGRRGLQQRRAFGFQRFEFGLHGFEDFSPLRRVVQPRYINSRVDFGQAERVKR